MNRRLGLLGLFFCLCSQALAAEGRPVQAMAMHGQPGYQSGKEAFDYVNAAAPKGGTLTQSVAGTFDTLNPFTLKGKPAQGLDYVYDRLAARAWDEPFTLYGLIAKEMIVPDDRASITFILDPKARFHDGKPVTADDVRFSFETLKKFGRPNMRRVYGVVEKVNVEGPRRIRFDLGAGRDRESVMILAMMPVLPAHDWVGRNFDETTMRIPVGSGPYRVKKVDAGRKIEYERVKNDWASGNISRVGQNNFDRLVFDYYRDDAVALEAFKAHAVDVRREFDTAKWQTAYKGLSPDIRLEELPHGRPEWVKGFIFNTRKPVFADVRVREALSYAFDADYVNATLYRGQGKRIASIFPFTELESSKPPAPPLARRDALLRADQMLNAAGWVVADNRRVRVRDGRALDFQILLSSAQDEKIALAFAAGLKKLGIEATVRTVDAAQFAGALASYDYDMVLHYWIDTLSPGTEQMIYWGCESAKTPGGKNYAGLCVPAIDEAARTVAQAKSRDDLVKSARALDALVMAQYPLIPLFAIGKDYWASWNTLAHPQNTPLYGAVLETWWAR